MRKTIAAQDFSPYQLRSSLYALPKGDVIVLTVQCSDIFTAKQVVGQARWFGITQHTIIEPLADAFIAKLIVVSTSDDEDLERRAAQRRRSIVKDLQEALSRAMLDRL